MPKTAPSSHIVTRSQSSKKKSLVTQTHTDICTCPHSESVPSTTTIMNEEQKKEFEKMFQDMCNSLRQDLAKESHSQRTQLDFIQTRLDKKPSSRGIKPDVFDGNPAVDALIWFDSFSRIAQINNWSAENRLSAFLLYLSGLAHAWFLSLPEDVINSFSRLKEAFQERFASGPHDWILSQQLSTRKQAKGERIDDYLTDITRLCKRLKLSDADSMRYFTQGLQPHIQSYVTLARPKTFQEAESLARMKELVANNQSVPDTQSVINQMEAMFQKLMTQTVSPKPPTIAAASAEPMPSQIDKRFDELSKQLKQLQKQTTQRPASYASVAAYDQQQSSPPRFNQTRNWQRQPTRQIDQMQRQINWLENELRRYQNPRRSDFRSYGRNFRTVEGDPICSFCQRVGHTWRTCQQRGRDPRLPSNQVRFSNRPQFSEQPSSRQPNSQLNE